MYPPLRRHLVRALRRAEAIPEERKRAIDDLAAFVSSKRRAGDVADGTPEETMAYDERCMQIASEMLYMFSRID